MAGCRLEGFALALLIGGEHAFAGVVVHVYGTAFAALEAGGLDLLAVDQGQDQAIGQERAQFLHQVEGQARAAGTVPVQEADRRVQAHPLQGRGYVVGQQGVEEREQGVDVVQGRAAAAATVAERLLLGGDQVVEHAEVGVRRFAFQAAYPVQVGFRPAHLVQQVGQVDGGGAQGVGTGAVGAVAQGAQQDGAAVGDFGGHQGLGNGAGIGVGTAVLVAPQQHVAVDGALHAGEEAPAAAHERQGHVALAAQAHQRGAGGDLAEADDAVQGVDGHAQPRLLFDAHQHGLALLGQVGAFAGDVEGVGRGAGPAWVDDQPTARMSCTPAGRSAASTLTA